MSIRYQCISEKLIEGYMTALPALKEQTLTKLSIQLCQHCDLKKHIICTPKPVSGNLYSFTAWEDIVARQSSTICETLLLPHTVKAQLILRIRSVALQLFRWNREHHIRLEISPQVVDKYLTLADWTAEGRINEKQVAVRIVKDEKIPVHQRYRLACLHFLCYFIRRLWRDLHPRHKSEYSNENNRDLGSDNQSYLVRLWSNHNIRFDRITLKNKDEHVDIQYQDEFYESCFKYAVREGQRTAVTFCWRLLSYDRQQVVIVNYARYALSSYKRVKKIVAKVKDIDIEYWEDRVYNFGIWCPMPAHFSDIFHFILSKMSEKQMVQFFEDAFEYFADLDKWSRAFPCFLESPYQDYFLPIITKSWSILPKVHYGHMLLILADRYANTLNKAEFQDYNYGRLLIELLERTPNQYKRYVFSDDSLKCVHGEENVGRMLLFKVFQKQSSEHRNTEIIQNILYYATVQEKQSIIYSKLGKYCIEYGNWEMLDLILISCLPYERLADFRKKFLLSKTGKDLCFRILVQENGDLVNLLLNWGNLSNEEIFEFKPKLVDPWEYGQKIIELMEDVKIDCLNRVLEWCLPSKVARQQLKDQFIRYHAKNICFEIMQRSRWNKLTQFLTWAFASEDVINRFKQELFINGSCSRIQRKLILREQWEDAELLVKWCKLSPEEIQQLKVEVMFSKEIFGALLSGDERSISVYLKWGLSNVETVMDFENFFDEHAFKNNHANEQEKIQVRQRWNQLMKDRIRDLAAEQATQGSNKRQIKYYLRDRTLQQRDSGKKAPPCKKSKRQ